uniref:Alpha/beta hydrolase-fold protein n=1 Tax=Roseihalotalea indica TaxID=2867963 RepID=A0AA49GM11_9BACT|nr:alpha/beta hydrolase-fold protein [Tunicatimonas sp. TK19036]
MFRTTELSDPAFESNHLRFITVKTPHLKGRGDICVFVPPGHNLQDIPLVILLHGVYGSCWVWALKAGAHLTAQQLIAEQRICPMVIAMPSDGLWGDGSAYLAHNAYDFERWIVEDVPTAVRENIPAVSQNSPQFISGLSMGGFGALRLGCKYPHRFKAISAHSSITAIDQMPLFVEEPLTAYQSASPSDHSVWSTLQRATAPHPALRFDCGTEDLLIEHNRTLHRQLTDAGIEHTYEEFPGGHEWAYWQTHLRDSLMFFNQQLR